jgi:hypothetical protein
VRLRCLRGMERRSRKYSDELLDNYKATFEPKYG